MAPLSIACSSTKSAREIGVATPSLRESGASSGSSGPTEEEYFSKMTITITKLHFNEPIYDCYFKIRIGDEFYTHESFSKGTTEPLPRTEFDVNEQYNFAISFHSQIFDHLQIDIYEPRKWRRTRRIGRVLLRLSHLHDMPHSFSSWFEILELEDATQELLGSRNFSNITINPRGAIELSIRYRYQSLSHLSQSVSSFTLKSPSSRIGSFPNIFLTHSEEEAARTVHEEHARSHTGRTRYLYWISFLSHFMDEDTYMAVLSIQKLLFAFGQGLNLSRKIFTMAVSLTSKFYARVPMKRSGRFVIDAGFVQHVGHVFKFATAAFGWMGINYTGHGKGVLLDVFRFEADRKCILEFLNIPEEDLLELNLDHTELFRPSYLIALDRSLEAVVLSIRGSMSVIDTITDLACHYQPWQGGLVHSGMYTAARWVMDNVMDRVVEHKQKYDMKRIIITGHSLGAAISALLGMMVREGQQQSSEAEMSNRAMTQLLDNSAVYNEQQNIHSYCFACPALVSAELLPLSEKNTLTFNYGNDIVPHLSYGSMMDYRIMLLTAAKFVKISHAFMGRSARTTSAAMHALTVCREELKAQNQHPKLICPGQYHQMYVLEEVPRDRNSRDFRWTVMERSDPVDFSELCIRHHMLAHHLPHKYEKAFKRIIESLKRRDAAALQ